VRWKTGSGDTLQIVANLSDGGLPMPALIDGDTLWPLQAVKQDVLAPADIVVRLRSNIDLPQA